MSVVHVALGRVIAEDSVDHDLFFVLGEPPVWTPAVLGLGRGGYHGEDGPDADDEG